MTMRETCEHLRELEDAIVAQRKVIGNLERRGLECLSERERLAELLRNLDATLRSAGPMAA